MPTSTHPTAQTGMPPRGGGRTLLHWVSILHRRGGRPCPPAENARFYGDLMRNRNILKGRCGHRPAESTRFMVIFRRIRVDFPFSTVGADDPVRPPEMPVFTEIRCEIAIF